MESLTKTFYIIHLILLKTFRVIKENRLDLYGQFKVCILESRNHDLFGEKAVGHSAIANS